MAIDRSIIGRESPPAVFEVEKGAIRRFAAAIGDETPAFARGEIAPPTFPTTFRSPVPGLALDLRRVLHGGEEYVYERPLRAGDVLHVTRRIEDCYEREGSLGKMTFYIVSAEGQDGDGEIVYRSRTTIIYR
ncbi:MAG: MaoC family dehydratase N-terminal domain-containing protein [Thermaerobacter sp.]|nr:MaoC family dehydratase N-terminal domain-containing protein [Thermaerobacter sp.]